FPSTLRPSSSPASLPRWWRPNPAETFCRFRIARIRASRRPVEAGRRGVPASLLDREREVVLAEPASIPVAFCTSLDQRLLSPALFPASPWRVVSACGDEPARAL